jgi:uncharacterized protein DUF4232
MVGLSIALSLLAGCTADPPPVPPTPRSTTPTTEPVCPDGIAVTAGVADAASGVRILVLHLSNCGDRPYTVNGYPEVRVLDADGAVLQVAVAPGSNDVATVEAFDAPPTPMTLPPGGTAVSGVLWRNTVIDGRPSMLGTALDVRPAPDADWQRITDDDPDGLHIDLGTTGRMGVRA